MKPASRRVTEPPAFELIEEAVHLLRRAPVAVLAIYGVGTVPFVLAGLFFWAHTTWFQPGAAELAWGALGLAGLFAAMKAAQAEFCGQLMALRLGAVSPAWSWRRLGRLAAAQLRVQPWVALALAPALVLTVPFGWVFAYAQSATVIGESNDMHGDAVAQAKLWPAQNHQALLILTVAAGATWLNLGAAFLAVPWLANHLLGIDNAFGLSGWWFFNSTFIASVTALTWVAVDPLVKAFYVLRVFHGRARRTGEDVRIELLAASRRPWVRAAAVAAVLLFVLPARPGAAEPAAPPPPAVQPAQLDRAIDEVLARSEFQWRLRQPPRTEEASAADGPVKRFVRQAVNWLRDAWRAGVRVVRQIKEWFDERFGGSRQGAEETKSSGNGAAVVLGLVQVLLYAFIAAAVVLLVWLAIVIWQKSRQAIAPVIAARAATAAAPDLRDENLQAAQLPADGWLALAREQMARGEWRLALRALYLTTLARLAADGLISLARFKTNLDYERELRRRALSRTELVARFSTRRRTFEDTWYGRIPAVEPDVRAWLAELERPASP